MRIPLVSWKLPSPGNTESRSSGTPQERSKDKNSESGVANCRNDENLVIFTWQTAVTAVSDMVRNVLFTQTFLDYTVKAPI